MLNTTTAANLVNRADLDPFRSALFRYGEGYVSVRVFNQNDRSKPPPSIKAFRVDDPRLPDEVEKSARHAATASTPCVFAPAIATFNNPRRARRADLQNGLAIVIELDAGDTPAAVRSIEAIIGPATLVVLSGGLWLHPETGEPFDKRHAYWRLSEPTTEQAEHDLLELANHHAALVAGADPTGAAICHCFRWPGSVHTKDPAHPVACTIERINDKAEVNLSEAAERLAEAVEAQGLGQGNGLDQAQTIAGSAAGAGSRR
jgi:hypothetical protein